MKYSFHVDNNKYTTCWLKSNDSESIRLKQSVYRFFEGDYVEYNKDNGSMTLIQRNISKFIPGTILLSDKMYGRYNTSKYFFKFVPYNVKLPEFLIPYKPDVSFKKKKRNKYVIVKFSKWPTKSKHPYGTITQSMGYVDLPEHTYEYLLTCYNVYTPIKTLKDIVRSKIKVKTIPEWYEYIKQRYNIIDRTKETTCVFSIDPSGTKDIDDACSITHINKSNIRLSIHIAHVPLWLDALEIWNEIKNNVSTVYLPHENKNMLPEILSEELCSLKEGECKFAFTLDVYLNQNYEIIRQEWNNVCVYIQSNDTYENVKREEYKKIFDIVRVMNNRHTYLSDGIHNSHEVVQYIMTYMNCEMAKQCASRKFGIFRTMKINDNNKDIVNSVPLNILSFMRIWNSPGGLYSMYTNKNHNLEHEYIGTSEYMHVTSPIRRLVDIINISLYLCHIHFFKSEVQQLLNIWYNEDSIQYINTKAKQIRRLQNECEIIHRTQKDLSILDKFYNGYVIEIIEKQQHIQYNIYIPELRITHYIEYEKGFKGEFKLFGKYQWKISYLEDEYKIRKRWLLTNM